MVWIKLWHWRKVSITEISTVESRWIFIPVGYSMVRAPESEPGKTTSSNLLTLSLCCLRLQKDMTPWLKLFLLLYSKIDKPLFSHAFKCLCISSSEYLFSFLFWGKAKASNLAYNYVVGRMLTLDKQLFWHASKCLCLSASEYLLFISFLSKFKVAYLAYKYGVGRMITF